MAEKPFVYQDPFPLGPDPTEYEKISSDYVSVGEFEGKPVLKIDPEGLTLLAAEAIKAINFTLRPAHLAQVAAILDDPDASENDRMVALMMLKNAEIAAHGWAIWPPIRYSYSTHNLDLPSPAPSPRRTPGGIKPARAQSGKPCQDARGSVRHRRPLCQHGTVPVAFALGGAGLPSDRG